MPGPPPKDNPVRRNKRVIIRLPKVTREPVPTWPLPDPPKHFPKDATEQELADVELRLMQAREIELETWATLWVLPQATIWHQQQNTRLVARYTRLLVAAELGNDKAASESRLLEDRLLLNPKALKAAGYAVDTDELSEHRELTVVKDGTADKPPTELNKRRRRMATDDGAASG